MKNVFVCTVLMAALLLAGCANKELAACQNDNKALQGQLSKATAALEQKNADIAKMKSENIDMQNKAMESIAGMLKKEEERSKKLQASIAEKDGLLKAETKKAAASEQTVAQLKQQIETLKADLDNANKAIETLKSQPPAAAEVAAPAN